jgi:hypothetical protein
MSRPVRRQVVKTLLIVGEGESEEALLRHLKAIYVKRDSGIAVTIKNARGKGAGNVIDVATRASYGATFDKKVVVLDNDQDWNARTKEAARKAKITVIASDPCLEASLLRAHHRTVEGLTPEQLKREFRKFFGDAASQSSVYRTHFDSVYLVTAARNDAFFAALIDLFQLNWQK